MCKSNNFVVWAADVGSIKNKRFGWCCAESKESFISGTNIFDFVKGISDDLSAGMKIALGFECPLFVPVTNDPNHLTSARPGEGNRSWSAGAGSGALAIGLTESVWVFENIRRMSQVTIHPTFDWEQFTKDEATNLFIWEAFVTGKAKSSSDLGDAVIAVRTFWDKYPSITSNVTAQNPYSLIGAALLRSGISDNIHFLFEECVVIKAEATV